MRILFLTTLALYLTAQLNAQPAGPISMIKKPLGGYVFLQEDSSLKVRDVVEIMQPNQTAADQMKLAQTNYTWATVFGGAGGFLIGWPLGTAIAGGDPEWGLLVAGAALVGISIPFSTKFVKQAQTAVLLYNEGIGATSTVQSSMQFMVQANGLGLRWQF